MMRRELHPSTLHISRDPELTPPSHRQIPQPPAIWLTSGEQAWCAERRPAVYPLPSRCPDPQVTPGRMGHHVCPAAARGASAQPARGPRPASRLWLRVFTPVCVHRGREGRGLCWGGRESAGPRAGWTRWQGRGGLGRAAPSFEQWVGGPTVPRSPSKPTQRRLPVCPGSGVEFTRDREGWGGGPASPGRLPQNPPRGTSA